ncbi:hypothetical protein B296_00055184 [Ensete ventricosum]|uniref:Serine/threonine-protein kinase BSK1-like TPR repeats domain-containing protein n=1 Tax=Ensete ventricosum TaxID=4639 RepID=A0A426Y1B2_ENSVE|nr:hypothetical protein B296_00055184 [Ensete ventricosum]
MMMSVPSATVFARRSLSYLMNGQPELALRDAMQAQVCVPEWPTSFYLQALALSKLGMEKDAQDMLNEGAAFEVKKQSSWRGQSNGRSLMAPNKMSTYSEARGPRAVNGGVTTVPSLTGK